MLNVIWTGTTGVYLPNSEVVIYHKRLKPEDIADLKLPCLNDYIITVIWI